MKKTSVLSILIGLLLLFLFASYTVLANNGQPQTCVGNFAGTSFGDLVVPEGQTCQLDRFNVVDGSIKVEKDASLIVCPDNEINGDVKAHQANSVFISDIVGGPCSRPKVRGITIDGDVKVQGGSSVSLIGNPFGGVAVIEGDVKVENVGEVSIQSFNGLSRIEGDVKVEHSGVVTIADNIIDGDLKIKGTAGACIEQNNLVSGKINSCP